jgi:DNA gyrase subunit A
MVCASDESATLLVVSENGYGKRSNLDEYRITNRGGKGVKAMNVTDKTGALVAIKEVTDSDDLMIINKSGIIIRISMSTLRIMGRATQGVRLIKVGEEDSISSVEIFTKEDEEEVEIENSDENLEIKNESPDVEGDKSEENESPESGGEESKE